MRCAQCGSEQVDGAMFCAMCGAAMAPGGAAQQHQQPSGWGMAAAGMSEPGAAPGGGGVPAPPGAWVQSHGQVGVVAEGTPFLQHELASWGQRLGGYILDGLIQAVILIVPLIVVIVLMAAADPEFFEHAGEPGYEPSGSALAVLALGVLALLAFVAVWQVGWVRSRKMGKPGQRMAGFVVTDLMGQRVSSGRSWGRFGASLIYNLSYLGNLLTIVTAFTIGMSARRQALHDMLAGTICVRRDALRYRGMEPEVTDGMVPVQQPPGAIPVTSHPAGGSVPGSSAPPTGGPFLP